MKVFTNRILFNTLFSSAFILWSLSAWVSSGISSGFVVLGIGCIVYALFHLIATANDFQWD